MTRCRTESVRSLAEAITIVAHKQSPSRPSIADSHPIAGSRSQQYALHRSINRQDTVHHLPPDYPRISPPDQTELRHHEAEGTCSAHGTTPELPHSFRRSGGMWSHKFELISYFPGTIQLGSSVGQLPISRCGEGPVLIFGAAPQ
jgi:hypothetical protein